MKIQKLLSMSQLIMLIFLNHLLEFSSISNEYKLCNVCSEIQIDIFEII